MKELYELNLPSGWRMKATVDLQKAKSATQIPQCVVFQSSQMPVVSEFKLVHEWMLEVVSEVAKYAGRSMNWTISDGVPSPQLWACHSDGRRELVQPPTSTANPSPSIVVSGSDVMLEHIIKSPPPGIHRVEKILGETYTREEMDRVMRGEVGPPTMGKLLLYYKADKQTIEAEIKRRYPAASIG